MVYDAKTREKVAEWAGPNVLPRDFAGLCVALGRFFNDALMCFDRSGPTGEVYAKRIAEEGYSPLVYARKRDGVTVEAGKAGVFLNPAVRTAVLHEYRAAVAEARMINRSERAMEECLAFVCKMDGSVEHRGSANATDPSGARANHGDIVVADALAWYALEGEGATEEAEEAEVPADSVGGRLLARERLECGSGEDELGDAWG